MQLVQRNSCLKLAHFRYQGCTEYILKCTYALTLKTVLQTCVLKQLELQLEAVDQKHFAAVL